jgi:hypothetical protein
MANFGAIEGLRPQLAERRPMGRWARRVKIVLGVVIASFWIPLGLLLFWCGLVEPGKAKILLLLGPGHAIGGVKVALWAARAWRCAPVGGSREGFAPR